MRAFIRTKRGKMYVVVTCDNCGQDNVFKLEHFLRGYVSGRSIFCKYCGQELIVDPEPKLAKKIEAYRRKIHA